MPLVKTHPGLHYMKKLFLIFMILAGFFHTSNASRIYTNFDIARWYLDSKYAIMGKVLHVDTILITRVDSTINDSTFLKYELVRERYTVRIDSIMKGSLADTLLTLDSREFYIDYSYYKQICHKITDTTSICQTSLFPYCDDNGDFGKLFLNKKMIVFFNIDSSTNITYSSENFATDLEIIKEVNQKGEQYFSPPTSVDQIENMLSIGPNPCSNYIKLYNHQDENYKLFLFDDTGREILENKILKNSECFLDLSTLTSGLYVYLILNDKGTLIKTGKLIKE
jgi:hypothetical protein